MSDSLQVWCIASPSHQHSVGVLGVLIRMVLRAPMDRCTVHPTVVSVVCHSLTTGPPLPAVLCQYADDDSSAARMSPVKPI